jgi:hypothetical protein
VRANDGSVTKATLAEVLEMRGSVLLLNYEFPFGVE